MTEDVSIRTASDEDVRKLVENPHHRRHFLEHLGNGRGILLFAQRAEVLVGHVFLRLGPAEEPELRAGLPGVPLLQHLEVLEGHKRGGVARQLLTEAEQRLYALGHRQVALGVSPDNEAAIALYRSLLFTLWRAQPLKTFREDLLDNGRIERVPELCLVFFKPLTRP
ncbi:hypothetical protein Aca07nite_76880 [Actinoplanes capillaceus]|uniref:N-acetyltransferase domain-containing protein n=1 Tax=Actinoplanes campanulatus TaxID=113559 RepID=A0ABQ3WVT8_9ACTN|nr:GNAT family N-acetyltransferase [Actinoplanes capillaceus]GID50413.1 hypothetical protein Aca07nite_76880 [Actinoplanes capillaceus]